MFFTSKERKLFKAIKNKDFSSIVDILDDVDANFFRNGMTPLMFAAKQGNVKAIEKIIQKGGDPLILDYESRSPLIYAAYSGNSKAVDILTLVSPKIVMHRDDEGLTAANYAYVEGHKEIVDKMEEQGFENRLPLHTLNKLGEVKVDGTGNNIKNINLDLNNNTRENKVGVVLPGTVFRSNDGSQDMVCTEGVNFDLDPSGRFQSNVSVACVNGEKPIPRSHNTFGRASYKDSDLIKIVRKMKGLDPNSLQAAIWAYKNNYSREELISKLREGNASRTVITEEHIKEAKGVLDELKIFRNI